MEKRLEELLERAIAALERVPGDKLRQVDWVLVVDASTELRRVLAEVRAPNAAV